jgi:hypothetical protein
MRFRAWRAGGRTPRIGDVFVVRKNEKPLWVPFPLAEALKPVAAVKRALFEQRREAYHKESRGVHRMEAARETGVRRPDWQRATKIMRNGGAEFLKNMEEAKCPDRSRQHHVARARRSAEQRRCGGRERAAGSGRHGRRADAG